MHLEKSKGLIISNGRSIVVLGAISCCLVVLLLSFVIFVEIVALGEQEGWSAGWCCSLCVFLFLLSNKNYGKALVALLRKKSIHMHLRTCQRKKGGLLPLCNGLIFFSRIIRLMMCDSQSTIAFWFFQIRQRRSTSWNTHLRMDDTYSRGQEYKIQRCTPSAQNRDRSIRYRDVNSSVNAYQNVNVFFFENLPECKCAHDDIALCPQATKHSLLDQVAKRKEVPSYPHF